jgi:alkylation response protein AidB-like acyl-CoA dehydrogenase
MQRHIFTADHEAFRRTVRDYLLKEVVPAYPTWEEAGAPPREFFRRAGEVGLVGLQVPEEFGGGGAQTFTYNVVLTEEAVRAGVGLGSLRVHMDVVTPYILHYANQQQKEWWLPGMANGDIMTAIAMTEPGTGSDLAGIRTSAHRKEDRFILNGAKTFITGGANADLILVVARTSPPQPNNRRSGLSILAVPSASPGFSVGRQLDKIGLKAQDTTELFFDNVEVPVENLLGEEGDAFQYLTHNLPQERLTIAVVAVASAASALQHTVEYTKARAVFGQTVASFQNTKFVLAGCAARIDAAQAFVDYAISELDGQQLCAADAAKVKLFCTEVQAKVVDECLQLHGGYGYMTEYPIARLYLDARVTRIYGGTDEILKTVISKQLGL